MSNIDSYVEVNQSEKLVVKSEPVATKNVWAKRSAFVGAVAGIACLGIYGFSSSSSSSVSAGEEASTSFLSLEQFMDEAESHIQPHAMAFIQPKPYQCVIWD